MGFMVLPSFDIQVLAAAGNGTFRHLTLTVRLLDILPPVLVVSPLGRFAIWTVHRQDVTPPGWFVP